MERARRLIAIQIAGGQLALLRGWLSGEVACSVKALAETIARTSRAAAQTADEQTKP